MKNTHGNSVKIKTSAIKIKTRNIEVIGQRIGELLENYPHGEFYIEIEGDKIVKDNEKDPEYQLKIVKDNEKEIILGITRS